MKQFYFHNPTQLLNGKGTHQHIGKLLSRDAVTSVLLVYGKSHIEKTGLLDDIVALLKKENITPVLHGGVVSNPVLSHARKGVELAKQHNVQAVLAVGGGSVVDESKVIAASAKMESDVWDIYKGKPIESALPLYVILTLSATGSEMNGGFVLTNEKTKEKFGMGSPYTYPKVSIVNPELAYTVPAKYLAYSAVDAISHAIEIYFNAEVLPTIQKRFIENIVVTVIETAERILENPKDYDARAEFSLATTWALNDLTNMGTGASPFPVHMIEHSLSALYNVAHGEGLAVVIPAWMKWAKDQKAKRFEQFAQSIFQLKTADDAISALEAWFKKIAAPITLNELNIDRKDINAIAENAYLTSERWQMKDIYTKKVIADILALA